MIDDLNVLACKNFQISALTNEKLSWKALENQSEGRPQFEKMPEGIHYSVFRYRGQRDSKMMSSIPIVLMLQFLELPVRQDYFEIQIAPKFLKYG